MDFYDRLLEAEDDEGQNLGFTTDEDNFEIFWIMGPDNFEMLSTELIKRKYRMVIIENRD